MSCPSLAAWLREEHLKVEALADGLRQTVALVPRVATPAWLEELRDRLGKFRAHLFKHMAMEEDGGYMTQVLARRPGLAGRVDRLQHQQRGRYPAVLAMQHAPWSHLAQKQPTASHPQASRQ